MRSFFRPASLILVLLLPLLSWGARYEGVVISIHDGDSIHVDFGNSPRPAKVRLAGTDSPEVNFNEHSQGDVAYEARDFLRQMLPLGATVTIITSDEGSGKDKHNRFLGRVIYNGRDLNAEMLRNGWSVLYVIAPYDKTVLRDYSAAAREGYENKRGMFSNAHKGTMMPYEFRLKAARQRGRNLLGDLTTRKLHSQSRMESVPPYARVFFPSLEMAQSYGFSY